MEATTVIDNVTQLAETFGKQRRERQQRTNLDKADFDALVDAGVLLTGAPASMGGIWVDVASSARPFCEVLRILATGDPSVALVTAMHPAVLGFWLTRPEAPAPYTDAWRAQSSELYGTALDGHWWGTVTSEPGSGGDITRSKATAKKDGDGFRISGQKHFGSGSGISSYMITTAVPEDEADADFFYLDMRGNLDTSGAPANGSAGIKLVAPWDGFGMSATQSHAFELTDYPAQRIAWPGSQGVVSGVAGAFFGALFTAVVVGVVESAHAAAAQRIVPRYESLRRFEAIEWARIETEYWLIEQAYERLLQHLEAKGPAAMLDSQHAKLAIAELAESLTQRLCRVIGGGSFSRSSHFGTAFEDVRALGFLRPPWALAYDQLLDRTWQAYAHTGIRA
jgi:alkylation response protein AidB-like acyl-CoA dehydrogenase